MKRSTSGTIIIGGIVSVIVVFITFQLTLFAIPPQGTTQDHDPSRDIIVLPDDFGELKPRQICHISDENDVISFMPTSNGSLIACPLSCEVVGNECVYPLSDEEIVRELRKGPQGLTQGEVAFVMKIVLSSTQVQEIIGERPYQTYCCGYESSYNQTHPKHDLLVSLNMNDKKEVVSVVVDLQTLRVTNIETDVPWGGSGEPTALPPLKQFKSGISAEDVECKQDLQLVIKSTNGLPACVKQESVAKLIERGWASLDHPINSKLLPVRPLRVSYEEFAGLLMGIKGDSIIEKQESESKITFITNMGNMEINKGLKSPAAIYTINKNPINMDDIDVVEYSKLILENIGYTQDGTESITSIGSTWDSTITFTQLINGAYQNSHHTTFYFSSVSTKIELGRWYDNISKIEFLVSNEDAKKIAYQYMQSEIERNPELQQRNMKAQIPTFSESLQIVDDRIAYYLDAAVGPNNHPELDSPNYVGVLVDVMTGQVLGWDYGKLEV